MSVLAGNSIHSDERCGSSFVYPHQQARVQKMMSLGMVACPQKIASIIWCMNIIAMRMYILSQICE